MHRLLPLYPALAKCFPIARSLWGGRVVWPSDPLLSRRARWEDLTVVSYTACPADWTPCVKMSFSVSSPVRWVIGSILSPTRVSRSREGQPDRSRPSVGIEPTRQRAHLPIGSAQALMVSLATGRVAIPERHFDSPLGL